MMLIILHLPITEVDRVLLCRTPLGDRHNPTADECSAANPSLKVRKLAATQRVVIRTAALADGAAIVLRDEQVRMANDNYD
jgi:hypothetical protein